MALHGKNILLRGCQLRNTEWCRGVVVYTGRETKIQMNAAEPATKSSSLKPYVDRETLRVLCVQVGGGVEAAFGGWCRSVVSHLGIRVHQSSRGASSFASAARAARNGSALKRSLTRVRVSIS